MEGKEHLIIQLDRNSIFDLRTCHVGSPRTDLGHGAEGEGNDNIEHIILDALEKAHQEYEIFNKTQPIESDFDRMVKLMGSKEGNE